MESFHYEAGSLLCDQVPIASNLIIDPDGKIQFYSLLDSANFDARLIRLTEVLDKLVNRR